MAYKFQVGSATLSGSLVREGEIKIHDDYATEQAKLTMAGVVSGSGEGAFGSIKLGGTAVTATAAELNYLDNSDLTAADITKLAALTATAAEINYLDNDDLTAADITKLAALTATAAEINYLDLSNAIGTVGASEAVVVDSDKDVSGFRNVTATGAFIIGSANLNEADMEQIDGITAGTVAASKAVVVDSNKDITGLRNVTATGYFEIGSAQLTESEMEMLDGITAGTVAASKAVVVDANKDIASFRHLTAAGAVTAGTSFIIGSADLNEADMEKLDGITNGTAAASKAVVLDASKDISGLNDVSAAGLTLSDLTSGRLPLVSTSGLLADNAQFSYDAGRNLNGYNNIAVSSSVSGSAYLGDGLLYVADQNTSDILMASGQGVGMGYDSTLQSGEGDNVFFFAPSSGDVKWQYDGFSMKFGKDSDVSINHVADTGLLLNSSRQLQFGDSGTYIHQSADGVLDLVSDSEIEINATTIDVNGALDVSGNSVLGGTLTAASLGTSTVDLTADLMIINDGAGGVIKNTSLANYATALAAGSNEGLSSTAGRLAVDLNDLSAATVNVANDSIAIIDADGSNGSKKESIADLVDAVAGAGLGSASGVLSLDIDELSALGGTGVAQGDHFVFSDGGTEKKITFSNMEDAIFGNVSGDATIAAGGALTIANDAVESGMLNDNVISGQTELGEGSLVAADELMISDGGVLKRIGADTLFINGPALLTEAAMTVADDYVMFLDAGATGDAKKEKWADLVALMAGAGLNASNGQLSTQSGVVAAIADGGTLAEGYNYLADISSNATVTLPASPSVGDVIHVKAADLNSGAHVIISKAGSQTIDDDHTSVRIESSFGAVSLVYVASNKWRLV